MIFFCNKQNMCSQNVLDKYEQVFYYVLVNKIKRVGRVAAHMSDSEGRNQLMPTS